MRVIIWFKSLCGLSDELRKLEEREQPRPGKNYCGGARTAWAPGCTKPTTLQRYLRRIARPSPPIAPTLQIAIAIVVLSGGLCDVAVVVVQPSHMLLIYGDADRVACSTQPVLPRPPTLSHLCSPPLLGSWACGREVGRVNGQQVVKRARVGGVAEQAEARLVCLLWISACCWPYVRDAPFSYSINYDPYHYYFRVLC